MTDEISQKPTDENVLQFRLRKADVEGEPDVIGKAMANIMTSMAHAINRDPKMGGYYSFGGYAGPHPDETVEEREARAARVRCAKLHAGTTVSPYMLDVNEVEYARTGKTTDRGMTVAELIDVLRTLPPQTQVNYEDEDGEAWPSTMVARVAEGVLIR